MKKLALSLFIISVFFIQAETKRIACIGDSITFGSGISNRSTDAYPAQLQKLLGDKYEVRNFGNPGRGVIKSSRRGSGWRAFIKMKEHQDALKFNPHIVICNLGINDIMDCDKGKWAEFAPDYIELIKTYQNLPTKPQVFIWTKLGPLTSTQRYFKSKTPFLLRTHLKDVAKKTGAIEIDMFSPLFGDPELISRDGIHPTAKGAKAIADSTYSQILPHITGDFGGLKMSYVFADHMVLQRNKPIPIWGTANARDKISIKFAGKTYKTTTNAKGEWKVTLPKMKAGGPYNLIVKGKNRTLTFNDILIGEVWISAGQSNMYWPMKDCARGKEDIPQANFPKIRILNRAGNAYPNGAIWNEKTIKTCSVENYYSGTWQACSPKTVANFSGVAYNFAKELHKELKVPVGIINVPIGGTIVEAFISEEALLENELLQPIICSNGPWFDNPAVTPWPRGRGKHNLKNWLATPTPPMPHHPFEPTFLYQTAIKPIVPFAIRGVIWYQGESNASTCTGVDTAIDQKLCQAGLETLIKDWREKFGQGDFPFLHVQLPGLNRPWAEFREMQLKTIKNLPNIGLAVTMDIGHPTDVHPRKKREVGQRLSKWALAKAYGKKIVYSGPIAEKVQKSGSTLKISFSHTGKGLTTWDKKAPTTFEVADKSGNYKPATAKISGKSIIVSSPEVANPVAVRYAWGNDPKCNLMNKDGLPASPFRLGEDKFFKK